MTGQIPTQPLPGDPCCGALGQLSLGGVQALTGYLFNYPKSAGKGSRACLWVFIGLRILRRIGVRRLPISSIQPG